MLLTGCWKKRWVSLVFAVLAALAVAFVGCGQSDGDDAEGEAGVLSGIGNVTGTVRSLNGSQGEMAGWTLVFMEKTRRFAHFGPINSTGGFTIPSVDLARPMSAVLLDPVYRLAAVITSPADTPGRVNQVFQLRSTALGSIIQRGPIIQFTRAEDILWLADTAGDGDSDLIPDGRDFALQAIEPANVDTDGDGLDNRLDMDIDGDGIVNPFDADDDADALLDIVDVDSNADGIADFQRSDGDLYYSELVEYALVQVKQQVTAEGALTTRLGFFVLLREGETIESMTVAMASSLATGAVAEIADLNSGVKVTTPWDGTLADDGLNEDGASADMLYGRTVIITDTSLLVPDQVVFVTVNRAGAAYASFPILIPGVVTAAFTLAFDAATSVVSLSAAPFTNVEFSWYVDLFDSLGVKIFTSELIPGTTTAYTIPSTLMNANSNYTVRVTATTLEGVLGFPAWSVTSSPLAIPAAAAAVR